MSRTGSRRAECRSEYAAGDGLDLEIEPNYRADSKRPRRRGSDVDRGLLIYKDAREGEGEEEEEVVVVGREGQGCAREEREEEQTIVTRRLRARTLG